MPLICQGGAEHEEYVHAYEGMVSLIRNAVKAKEQQKIAEELRLQEEVRERRRIEEQQRIREIKRAKNKSLFRVLAVIFFIIFLLSSVVSYGGPSLSLLVFCIVFLILGFLK